MHLGESRTALAEHLTNCPSWAVGERETAWRIMATKSAGAGLRGAPSQQTLSIRNKHIACLESMLNFNNPVDSKTVGVHAGLCDCREQVVWGMCCSHNMLRRGQAVYSFSSS